MSLLRRLLRREPKWHDPTYGMIDRDIQDYVTRMEREDGVTYSTSQRIAIELSLQNKRGRRF